MSPQSRKGRVLRLSLISALSFLAQSLWLPPATGSLPPAGALQAFESLHAAESAGANIGSLVSQYNSLLLASAPGGSFQALQSQALEAENRALAQGGFERTLILIAVPTFSLLLSLALHGVLYLRARVADRKLLDQEIRKA